MNKVYLCYMSKVTSLYHIVFCTKYRKMTLPLQSCEDLYRFIWSETTDMKCRLLRIGGIQNHVHMLIDLHSSLALSKFVQTIKSNSSGWMRSDVRFPDFTGWAAGFYACSVSPDHRDAVIEYIKGQRSHHLIRSFDNELERLMVKARLSCDDRFMK